MITESVQMKVVFLANCHIIMLARRCWTNHVKDSHAIRCMKILVEGLEME